MVRAEKINAKFISAKLVEFGSLVTGNFDCDSFPYFDFSNSVTIEEYFNSFSIGNNNSLFGNTLSAFQISCWSWTPYEIFGNLLVFLS